MEKIQILRQIQRFLDRTPIVGEEAAAMIVCKNWVSMQERTGPVSPAEPPTPPSQVADTSGK